MEIDITSTPVYAEMDMSTIVYLAFAALALIARLFGKSKKKQQQQGPAPDTQSNTPASPRNAGKTFEELLQEFTGNAPESQPERAPTPVAVERTEPRSKPKPSPKSVNNPYQEAMQKRLAQEKREKDSAGKQGLSRFEEFEDEEVEENDYAKLLADSDSAQKAFVLSEIFQRKY